MLTKCEKRFGPHRLYHVSDNDNNFIGNFCAGCMANRIETMDPYNFKPGRQALLTNHYRDMQKMFPADSCPSA